MLIDGEFDEHRRGGFAPAEGQLTSRSSPSLITQFGFCVNGVEPTPNKSKRGVSPSPVAVRTISLLGVYGDW